MMTLGAAREPKPPVFGASDMGPVWETSIVDDVDGTSDKQAVDKQCYYRITASTDLWWTVAATGGAAAASSGSHFLKTGQEVLVYIDDASMFVHYIQDSGAGNICISRVSRV